MISRRSGSRCALLLSTIVLGTMVLFWLAGRAFADGDHDRAKQLKEAGAILPLERIIETAQKAHPGQLLEAELEEKKGRFVYELELLDAEGIVWELEYDARSGELLNEKRER